MFCTCGASHELADVFCKVCRMRIYGATLPLVQSPYRTYCACGTEIAHGTQCNRCANKQYRENGLTGKAGDYHVRSGGNEWIVDREIFENGYEEVKP